MNSEYLLFVSQDNHNKWYRMTERDDGQFLAEWGRVGAAGQTKLYPAFRWEEILREKLGKGYTRVVGHGTEVVNTAAADSMDIKDPEVKALVSFLMRSAKQSIVSNYSVSASDVTKAQIEEAQRIIGTIKGELDGKHSKASLNDKLERLYRTIPRKMADTRKYFLRDDYKETFVRELLQSEQGLLDTLESQAQGGALQGSLLNLESLGLEIGVASQADRNLIGKETDFRVSGQKIFKVSNKNTLAKFKGGKTKLLYHGTKNQNWMSLIQRGLLIRPAGVSTTGSMLGNGIYGADKAKKSIGYTSLKGSYWASGAESKAYLGIFEFSLGKQWKIFEGQTWASWMSRLDYNQVKNKGFDSVFAKGGIDLRNSEYVVFQSSQCNIRYLIELTA